MPKDIREKIDAIVYQYETGRYTKHQAEKKLQQVVPCVEWHINEDGNAITFRRK